MKAKYIYLLFLWLPLLSGCGSLVKGVTEGFLASQNDKAELDRGICVVRGPAYEGIAASLAQQTPAEPGRTTKVLMVHGIGKHIPGYSGRLQNNLTRALGLNVVQEQPKEFTLLPPQRQPDRNLGAAPLGNLRVDRYTNKAETRELLFYELTWSGITEPIKATLAYDGANEFAQYRAGLNRVMKNFFNSHIPDPIIYTGNTRHRILAAVTQSICWMIAGDWADLPQDGEYHCDALVGDTAGQLREDDIAIITHSLGSRIALDALQAIAQSSGRERIVRQRHPLVEALQNTTIPLYMLANQLPLLQLGFVEPEFTGQIPRYCQPEGDLYQRRLFQQVRIVAFSDPNDILSYGIPPDFDDDYVDSQLCPQIVNITVNVAPVTTIPVVGDFANPLAAHSDYEADERVIGLITHGIGTPRQVSEVTTQCQWLETRK